MKLEVLIKKYPKFIYRNYEHKISGGNLKISFLFEIPPSISFRPRLIIKDINEAGSDPVSLDNLVFHVDSAGGTSIIAYSSKVPIEINGAISTSSGLKKILIVAEDNKVKISGI